VNSGLLLEPKRPDSFKNYTYETYRFSNNSKKNYRWDNRVFSTTTDFSRRFNINKNFFKLKNHGIR
jgi:hypothetical protein